MKTRGRKRQRDAVAKRKTLGDDDAMGDDDDDLKLAFQFKGEWIDSNGAYLWNVTRFDESTGLLYADIKERSFSQIEVGCDGCPTSVHVPQRLHCSANHRSDRSFLDGVCDAAKRKLPMGAFYLYSTECSRERSRDAWTICDLQENGRHISGKVICRKLRQ